MKYLKPYKGCSILDVTQGFNDLHHAIDWLPKRKLGLGAYGTPLVAPEDCVIGKIYDTTDSDLKNGYGLWMKGVSGFEHEYWHCNPVFPVSTGDTVKKGTIVGYVGNSGNVTISGEYVPLEERDHAPFSGTHLHQQYVFQGKLLNPLEVLDLETEPDYTIWDELKAISITLLKISTLLKK